MVTLRKAEPSYYDHESQAFNELLVSPTTTVPAKTTVPTKTTARRRPPCRRGAGSFTECHHHPVHGTSSTWASPDARGDIVWLEHRPDGAGFPLS